jgi:hypothetical protein
VEIVEPALAAPFAVRSIRGVRWNSLLGPLEPKRSGPPGLELGDPGLEGPGDEQL